MRNLVSSLHTGPSTPFWSVNHVQLDVVASTCCLPETCDTPRMGMISWQNFDHLMRLPYLRLRSLHHNQRLVVSIFIHESWILDLYQRLDWCLTPVLTIWIILHGFRHRGCLRSHPLCCHPWVWIKSLTPIKVGPEPSNFEDLCLVNVSVKYFSKLCFGTIKIQPELKYLKPILEDLTSWSQRAKAWEHEFGRVPSISFIFTGS